jgi:hypothetical protein
MVACLHEWKKVDVHWYWSILKDESLVHNWGNDSASKYKWQMRQYEIHMVWYQRYLAHLDKGILKMHWYRSSYLGSAYAQVIFLTPMCVDPSTSAIKILLYMIILFYSIRINDMHVSSIGFLLS